MKAEIIALDKIFNDVSCSHSWQVILQFDKLPPYKLGECRIEVKQ